MNPAPNARYKKAIYVRSDDDTDDCLIFGIAVMTGCRVVITDEYNEAVKLIDVENDKIISRVSLSASPRDVTAIETNKVAVIQRVLDTSTSAIVLINVTDVLSILTVIQVPNTDVYGICAYRDNLLVACSGPSCLKEIDMSGKVIKTLNMNTDGDVIVSSPTRLAMNSDQTLIYITDCNTNTVTTVTMDGKIEHVYKSDNLQYPIGVTVGRYGEVFVCSMRSHTIHQLSPTGRYIRVLLEIDQNLADFPTAIDHSDDDNTLYISSHGDELHNYIRVFQLE